MTKYTNNQFDKNNKKKHNGSWRFLLIFPFLLGAGFGLGIIKNSAMVIISLIITIIIVFSVIRSVKELNSNVKSDYKMQSGEIKYGQAQNYAEQIRLHNGMQADGNFRDNNSSGDNCYQNKCPICGKIVADGYCGDCGYKFN